MRCAFVFLIVVVGLSFAAPASAQTERARGPFAGLFGARSTSGQTLDLRGSVYGSHQKTLLPGAVDRTLLDPNFEESGKFAGASVGASYGFVRDGEGSNFSVSLQGSLSKSSAASEMTPYQISAGTSASTTLTRRVRLSILGGASYSPHYGFRSYESGLSVVDTNYSPDPTLVGQPLAFSALAQRTLGLGGTASLTADLARRTSFSVISNWNETKLLDTKAAGIRSFGGEASLRQEIARGLGVHLGFGRQISQSFATTADRVVNDNISAGVDYSGSFSLGRRTNVTFGSSTSVVRWEDESQFRLNANASLVRAMAETWSASLSYLRDVGFLAGLREPVFSDSVTASLGGQLASRLSVNTSASWYGGMVGRESAGGSFHTYMATTGLQLALTRGLGVYGQYGYFHYRVPPDSSVLDLLTRYSRQTVSAGLTVWVPIVSTGRRGPSDPG